VRGFEARHINTDFPASPSGSIRADDQRVSDHDPLLVRLVTDGPVTRTVHLPVLLLLPAAWPPGRPSPTAAPTSEPTLAPPTPTRTPRPGPTGSATWPAPSPTATTAGPTPSPTQAAGSPPRFPLRIDEIHADGAINPAEPDEHVAFTNVAGETLDLTGWHLVSVQGNQVYSFPDGQRIAAGQTCRVYTDELHPEHCGLSWRSGQAIWRNGGDKAELRDAAGRLVDHACYGDRADDCP
jgi:hypothetical protein